MTGTAEATYTLEAKVNGWGWVEMAIGDRDPLDALNAIIEEKPGKLGGYPHGPDTEPRFVASDEIAAFRIGRR